MFEINPAGHCKQGPLTAVVNCPGVQDEHLTLFSSDVRPMAHGSQGNLLFFSFE